MLGCIYTQYSVRDGLSLPSGILKIQKYCWTWMFVSLQKILVNSKSLYLLLPVYKVHSLCNIGDTASRMHWFSIKFSKIRYYITKPFRRLNKSGQFSAKLNRYLNISFQFSFPPPNMLIKLVQCFELKI